MNSLERIRRAAHREPVERVPVAPYMGNHGARIAGVPIGENCRSGRIMAEAQYRAWQIYGQDVVVAQSDNYYIAEGFGVKVQHYDDATPTLLHPAIESLAELPKLRVPDPHRDGRMPWEVELPYRPEHWIPPGLPLSGSDRFHLAVSILRAFDPADATTPTAARQMDAFTWRTP